MMGFEVAQLKRNSSFFGFAASNCVIFKKNKVSAEIIAKGPDVPFEVFEGSLAQYLIPKIKSHPKGTVLQVNGETGESQTSQEFLEAGLRVAEGLKNLGVKQDEVIALVGNYSSRIFAAAIGSVALGAPFFPIDPSFKTLELKHLFNLCEPRVVFCEKQCTPYVIEALDLLKNQADVVILYGENENSDRRLRKFESILKETDVENYRPVSAKNPKEQIALIVGSSGTTGFPKAVAITHRSLIYQLQIYETYQEVIQKTPYLQVTHIFWITGIYALFWTCLNGGIRRVYVGNVTGSTLLNAIHKYKPEWSFMPPIHLSWMLNHPDFCKFDVTSMKHVCTGGSVLQTATINQMREKWPVPVKFTQLYGMTELTGGVTIPTTKDIATVGEMVIGINVKVVDVHTGKSLGPNQSGELRFQSDHGMMKCYLGNEEATKEALDETGYYKSGDLGYFTEDNLIYLTNRIKDLIKCKNHQVSPVELEDVILNLPGVQDVAVVGVPHETDQYRPLALVVKKEKAEITAEFIIKSVADSLSEHKQLYGGVKFVGSIPRTPNGKIQRPKLIHLV